jgi:hypothetical protein
LLLKSIWLWLLKQLGVWASSDVIRVQAHASN